MSLQRGLAIAAVTASCSTALAWLAVSPTLPLARDQGILAWVGTTLLSGGLPYADAWEHKGPLSHLLYALALASFGHSSAAIQVFNALALLGMAACLVLLCWRLGGGLAGAAAVGLLFLQLGTDYWNSAQPDTWAGGLLLLSSLLVLLGGGCARGWLLSGIAIGSAVLIKPVYVLHCVVLAVVARHDPEHRPRRLVCAALGAASPVAICCGIYLAHGQLGALLEAYLRFNWQTHLGGHALELAELWSGLASVAQAPGVLIATALAAVGYGSPYASHRPAARALLVGGASALLAGCVQSKFYSYHFAPFAIQLAPLAGLGVHELASRGRRGAEAERPPALAALLLAWYLVSVVAPASQTLSLWRGLASPSLVQPWQACNDFCHADIAEAATWAQQRTAPGAPIYLWGFDALVYFLADRPSATRFGFNYPLLAGSLELRQSARAEVLRDLLRIKPMLILVEDRDANNLYRQSSKAALADFEGLAQLLARDYVLAFNNASFEGYRRL